MIILSIDPGAATGYAVCNDSSWSRYGVPCVIETGVLLKWKGLRGLIDKYTPDVIVAEKFILYAGRAKNFNHDTLVVVRVLGVIEYLAEQSDTLLIEQTASVGKSVRLPDSMLGRNSHVRDALRHAIAYLRSVGD